MLDTVLAGQTDVQTLSSYLSGENEESCPVCRGTGWEQAFSSGRLGVRRCSADVHLRQALLRMGIDPKYWRSRFENFEILSEASTRTAARLEAIAGDPDYWRGTVVLCGGAGKGKTHLLTALIVRLLSQGRRDVAYHEMSRLLARVQAGANTRRERTELLRALCEIKILIIDGWDRLLGGQERQRLRSLLEARAAGPKFTLLASRLEESAVLRQISSSDSQLSRRNLTVLDLPERDLHSNLFLI